MKPFKMMLLGTMIISSAAYSGNEGSGGGDANTRMIRELRNLFRENGAYFRNDLTTIFTNVTKFRPVGGASTTIHDLMSRGVLRDIKRANYRLQTECRDENGVVRSASTLRTDLTNLPDAESPEICINARKLAEERAGRQEILGLLAHEHSRHFGMEDTDDLGFHPLADFVAARSADLLKPKLTEAPSLDGVVLVSVSENEILAYGTRLNSKVTVVFERLRGSCGDLTAVSGISSFGGATEGVAVGRQIELSVPDLSVAQPRVNFYIDSNFMDLTPIATFGLYNRKCEGTFRIKNGDAISPPYKMVVNSNLWRPVGTTGPNQFGINDRNTEINLGNAGFLNDAE